MKTFAVFFCLQRRKRRTSLLFHELLSVFWDISHCCVLQLCGFTVVFHTELCSQQRPRGHWCLSCCGSCVFSVVFDKGSISLFTWSCVFTVLFSLTVVLYTEVCFHSCVIHGGVFTSEAKGTLADASGGSWRFSHQPFLQHLIMVYVMVVLCCLFVCLLFSLTDNSPTSISYNTTSFARRENYD